MLIRKIQQSFDGGEISPWLDGRTDLAKYASSCRLVENFIPLPQGGLLKRPGRRYLGPLPSAATSGKLVEFEVQLNQSYILVIGGGKMRVIYNNAFVMDGSSIYEINVPWADDELDWLRWRQLNDVMFFVHRNHPPQVLVRGGTTSWTLSDFVPGRGQPFLPENLDRNHRLRVVFDTLADTVSVWGSGNVYKVGKIVSHSGQTYRCDKQHTSGSTPPSAGATYFDDDAEEDRLIWTPQFLDKSSTIGQEVTFTSNKAIFSASHVGSYWRISKKRNGREFAVVLPAYPNIGDGDVVYSPVRVVQGRWTLTTRGTWFGEFFVELSRDRGQTWTEIRWVRSRENETRNASIEGEESVRALIRLGYRRSTENAALFSGGPHAELELFGDTISGVVQVTEVTDSRNAKAITIERVEWGSTFLWAEGAWSDRQGYPNCLEIFQNRVLLAGTIRSPHTVWGSAVDDYNNFRAGTLADEPFAHTIMIGQREPIAWMLAERQLIIGSAVGEFVLRGENDDTPVTPETGNAMQQSAIGSHLRSDYIRLSSSTLFVQHGGKIVRELNYTFESDRYEASNLTLLADHLFTDEINDVAVQRFPFQLVWFIAGGKLYSLTYEKGQKVAAWARHPSEGEMVSVACLRKAANDEVWFIVDYDGDLVVERMLPGGFTLPVSNGSYSDSWMDISSPYSLSGNHLAGKTVVGWNNGNVIGPATLNSGFFTGLSGSVRVGLPYAAKVQPMTPEVDLPDGNSRTTTLRVVRVTPNLYRSEAGQVAENADGVGAVALNVDNLFSGDAPVTIDGRHNTTGDFCVISNTPHPFNIRTISTRIDFSDDEDKPVGGQGEPPA